MWRFTFNWPRPPWEIKPFSGEREAMHSPLPHCYALLIPEQLVGELKHAHQQQEGILMESRVTGGWRFT